MMKVLLILVLMTACGCSQMESTPHSKATLVPFEAEYRAWESNTQARLHAGVSWILPDEMSNALASRAQEHESFLRDRLAGNMFVCIILESSELKTKYNDPSKGLSSLQERQAAWLKAMK